MIDLKNFPDINTALKYQHRNEQQNVYVKSVDAIYIFVYYFFFITIFAQSILKVCIFVNK